ncbi:hypothetical protein [Peptoniphilus sp.]|jgi:hypothetical protein|uniref:hypothetical protein n=1 Tax=Peptoniphilus sp. TaxID=1971214 RepID=UPI003D8C4777
MKRKIILIITFLIVFTTAVCAEGEKINAKVYYFEDLTKFGYELSREEFEALDSSEKQKITYKIISEIYSQKIENNYDINMDLEAENKFDFKKSGYYLFTFDKNKSHDKIITSNPILLYSSGSGRLYVKESMEDIDEPVEPSEPEDSGGNTSTGNTEASTSDKKTPTNSPQKNLDLNVVFDYGEFDFSREVEVGLYDAHGNLVAIARLNRDNNYRYTFHGLDYLKNYIVKPHNLESYDYTIDRVADTYYIEIIGYMGEEKQRGDDAGYEELQEPKMPEENETKDEDFEKLAPAKLPQTGVMWLPVFFLFAIGIIFIIIGRKSDKNE